MEKRKRIVALVLAILIALSAGSYPAVAVMSVYDEEDAVVSATRVPVTIQVG